MGPSWSPAAALNDPSVASLREVGVDHRRHPKADTQNRVRAADVGSPWAPRPTSTRSQVPKFQTWITDEPSERGIEGIERMRLVRDHIATRGAALARDLGVPAGGSTAR